MTDRHHRNSRAPKRSHHQEAELSVAQDHDFFVARLDFIEHVERGCQRFGEHSALVGHAARNLHQTILGHHELLGQCPIARQDPEHASGVAMMTVAFDAILAATASRIDVGDDALSAPARVVGLDDFSNEFVAEHAAVVHVTPGELQIGVAHSGQAYADPRLPGPTFRSRMIGGEARRRRIDEGEHGGRVLGHRSGPPGGSNSALADCRATNPRCPRSSLSPT